MNELNNFLLKIESYLGGSAWFTILLLGTGVFYTIYLKFPQIRYFRHAIRVVFGKYDKEGDTGDTSHFQALTTALSGTIGTGNIAGVAFAIYLGGPAALFWMLVTAFLGMTTKFVEVTLSHKYREKDEHGMISGGPMYYMKNKLNAKYLAIFFALMTVISSFGTGNMPQINSIASSMNTTFGFDKWIVGLVLAIILAFVILGGIKRIASVTEKLVPGMALIYLIGALAVIFNNYENIIPSFQAIFGNILSGTAATGGFLGASFSYAFNRGVNRGLFSNEAGQGSAPIAHAAARTEESVSEGLVSILEPFIDTIVICTITGLVILSSGVWKEKHSNTFQKADMVIMADVYNDSTEGDHEKLYSFVYEGLKLETFSGNLEIIDGQIKNNLSIINSHSIAEDVKIYNHQDSLFTGILPVVNGNYHSDTDIYFKGKSLIHSAPLTAEAFSHSIFGKWGKWIVTIGLLLFAFSTSIAWAYYGGRSIMFLVGAKGILPYRIIYCIGFFVASFIDTSIVWTISGISIVLMAIPNLVGILLLSKDMKTTVSEYWQKFDKEHKR